VPKEGHRGALWRAAGVRRDGAAGGADPIMRYRIAETTMRMSVLIAALLFASVAHAEQPTAAVRKQIVDLTQRIMDALGEGKPELWQRALLEDALITDEFGRRQTKKEAIDSIRPFPPGISRSIEGRDPHARVYGTPQRT